MEVGKTTQHPEGPARLRELDLGLRPPPKSGLLALASHCEWFVGTSTVLEGRWARVAGRDLKGTASGHVNHRPNLDRKSGLR